MFTKNYEAKFEEFAQEIAPVISDAEEQIEDLDPEISMQDIEKVLAAENKDDAIEALLDKKESEALEELEEAAPTDEAADLPAEEKTDKSDETSVSDLTP